MIIKCDCGNLGSFADAAKAVRNYQKAMEHDAYLLREMIAFRLSSVAANNFRSAVYEDLFKGGSGGFTPNVKVTVRNEKNFSVVIASGREAIFVEFGAGVYHNGSVGTSPHPKGNELGYLIGTYRENSKGRYKAWAFMGADGEWKVTRGTRAQMPMYNAMKVVVNEIDKMAREIFTYD